MGIGKAANKLKEQLRQTQASAAVQDIEHFWPNKMWREFSKGNQN